MESRCKDSTREHITRETGFFYAERKKNIKKMYSLSLLFGMKLVKFKKKLKNL